MLSFYSTSTELCLACSGSAISGSQRPRPISKPHSNAPFSPRERPNPGVKTESNSDLVDSNDFSKYLDLEETGHETKDDVGISIFRTQCCNRPICAACLTSNPRLARYVPCLACLGGVRAVAGPSTSPSLKHPTSEPSSQKQRALDTNLNGALRDRDVFVLGDDEEEDDDDEDCSEAYSGIPNRQINYTPPPAYSASEPAPVLPDNLSQSGSMNVEPEQLPGDDRRTQWTQGSSNIIYERQNETNKGVEILNSSPKLTPHNQSTALTDTTTKPTPRKHYIKKGDTLRGLALRYGVDGRALCRLNNLPPSTLTTTPHLLHTRTTLILPPSAKSFPPGEDESRDYDPDRERRIKLEKTAKRLQLITKEENWDVAKAYAVLAQPSSSSSSSASLSADLRARINESHVPADQGRQHPPNLDEKSTHSDEKELTREKATMQERALDAYLEDDAWEARERAAGRGPPSSTTSGSPVPSSSKTKLTPTSRRSKLPAGQTAKKKKAKRFV